MHRAFGPSSPRGRDVPRRVRRGRSGDGRASVSTPSGGAHKSRPRAWRTPGVALPARHQGEPFGVAENGSAAGCGPVRARWFFGTGGLPLRRTRRRRPAPSARPPGRATSGAAHTASRCHASAETPARVLGSGRRSGICAPARTGSMGAASAVGVLGPKGASHRLRAASCTATARLAVHPPNGVARVAPTRWSPLPR
jgi:hypothetical protein